MTAAATALAVLAAVAAGASGGIEPDPDDVPDRFIIIDSPRLEGHPCRAEAVAPGTPPPGAIPYVVDVCVHRTVAKTFYERRPNSVRPTYEP